MRYLKAYPTEEQLVTSIIPALQEEEENNSKQKQNSNSHQNPTQNQPGNSSSGVVKWPRFESFMLRVFLDRLYEPDSEETLLQAFRTLDPEGKGYLDETTLIELLSENEWAFRDKEMEDFLRVAKDPDTGYIHYEDYVAMMDS